MGIKMTTDDVSEIHFGLRLFDRDAVHAYCENIMRVLSGLWNCSTRGVSVE